MPALYDTIGVDYARLRRPDPRIGAVIHAALGEAKSVLNVGAGAGSYEPAGHQVTALEPSIEMIAQRPADAALVLRGRAEALPFPDDAFDAAMAVLTVHHWSDQAAGLKELRRVARGPVAILTYDPGFHDFWLTDYLPELIALDEAQMPPLSLYAKALGPVELTSVPIPQDCSDGFLCAYWRRPRAYLDARIRAGISSFWKIRELDAGLARLEADLDSGAWVARYGAPMEREAIDCGYRLVTAR
jgi:SAM-dependent methyltransferase